MSSSSLSSGLSSDLSSGDHAVVVEDLVIRYGKVVAVDHASFTADKGEVTVLLGPNGAGKTSTVEHLVGYRRRGGGHSSVLGLDPIAGHGALSSRVGVMLQEGGIPMAIRPPDVLRQYAGFFDDPLDPGELLDLVDLGGQLKTPYRKLSGGQKQRLSLALALIGRPEVAFLDEPSAGVDLAGRDVINRLIEELRNSGACVVVTTHDLTEAEKLADRVVIMDQGKVVANGALGDLLASDAADEVLFTAEPKLDLQGLGILLGQRITEIAPGEYRAPVPGSPRALADIATWFAEHDLQLLDLRAGRLRLDDVFRRLTGSTEHHSGAEPTISEPSRAPDATTGQS